MSVVEYEKRGPLVIITMNRPERLNAQGKEIVTGLADAWTEFQNDDTARVGIITGVGRAFCAGMDVRERIESGQKGLALDPASERDPFWRSELHKPTIAAVNGFAYGGGWILASRADLRVALASARFQYTEIVRGATGTYNVQMLHDFTSGVAAELALGGVLSAQRLYEAGFLNRVVEDPDALLPSAVELAEGLLRLPPLSVRYTVELMHRMRDHRSTVPPEVQEAATAAGAVLRNSADTVESLRSFIEKRQPAYQGR